MRGKRTAGGVKNRIGGPKYSLMARNHQLGASVDFDCDRVEHPELETPGDYNRNSTIESIEIKSVNISGVARRAWGTQKTTAMDYVLERLLYINEIYHPDNWDIEVNRGYYGEEAGEPCLEAFSLMKQLDNEAAKIGKLPQSKAIERILELEYGTVPPQAQGLHWRAASVPKGKVVFDPLRQAAVDLNHARSLYEFSYAGDLPLGIAVFNAGKFDLLDGYHRLAVSPPQNGKWRLLVGR